MKIRSIKYYIKEGFKSLIKNRLMSVASIITVSVCIFMVTLSYCLSVNIDYMLEGLQNSIGISAFADDNLDLTEVNALLKKLQETPHVKSVEYISPAEGLESMKAELGDDNGILDGYINDNPLSASFSITVDGAEYQKSVVKALENIDGIRKVKHALSVTDTLISISKAIHIISIILISVLCVVSVVIIVNTIKLAVYIRRTEINIMKYVGATDWFIRWPFIIEGTLIGIIGSIIPIMVCTLAYDPMILKISTFPLLNQIASFRPADEIFYKIIPIAIIVGVFIGTFGSIISVRKHLQV